jgi:hypothetical protein
MPDDRRKLMEMILYKAKGMSLFYQQVKDDENENDPNKEDDDDDQPNTESV